MEYLENKIKLVYQTSKNYPDLVKGLVTLGITSYTVDVASGIIFYRLEAGVNSFHPSEGSIRKIVEKCDKQKIMQAVKDNQEGKTTYPEFMDQIALAGVRFYEATLIGDQKRVTYIGSGDYYEELIPY